MIKQLFDTDSEMPKRGRPKYSSNTPAKMIERFLKRNISPTRLQKMFNKLTNTQQVDMLILMLPYVVAKKQPDSISASEIDELYEKLENEINKNNASKVG